jgi:hypothetical protein
MISPFGVMHGLLTLDEEPRNANEPLGAGTTFVFLQRVCDMCVIWEKGVFAVPAAWEEYLLVSIGFWYRKTRFQGMHDSLLEA